MSQDVPEWFNEEFLSSCLQDGEEDKNIGVKTFNVTSVSPPGNNYGSCIWRVNVDYKEGNNEIVKHKSLIVKGPQTTGTMKDLVNLFEAEPMFYKTFLPLASNIAGETSFAPKYHFSSISSVVALEDLREEGYFMADRRKGLDFDHCCLYARASATFHAVSVAVHKTHPELIERLGSEKLYPANDLKPQNRVIKVMEFAICYLSDKMRTMEEFKKYSDLLRSSADKIYDMVVEAHQKRPPLNALHQGDPWTTNMMFRYDQSGKVADIKLIDYQALRYASPVNDLVFFIWTSANHDVREHNLEDLYRVYCDALNNRLQEYNCPEKLSYEQLLENVNLLNPLAILISSFHHPLMVSEKLMDITTMLSENSDNKTIENLLSEYYDEEYCAKHLQRVLKQLEHVGAFEYLKKLCI